MSTKLFNKIHCTEHDKLDLITIGVTITDYCWLIGDMVFSGVHPHHLVIFTSLSLLSLMSVMAMKRMIKRHHKSIKAKVERRAREDAYVPQSRQSEK